MSTPTIAAPEAKAKKRRDEHATGLLIVGLFKLMKAVFFGAVGIEALHLIHSDLADLVMRAIDFLHINPVGKFANFLNDRVDLIGHHQLRQAGLYSIIYAGLCVVEGIGLMKCKVWAEYFTVILTTAALPWETYEMIHRYEPYKIGLLAANIAVLVYLVWLLQLKKRKKSAD